MEGLIGIDGSVDGKVPWALLWTHHLNWNKENEPH